MPFLGPVETPEWLLIDADDTLWENNLFFEEAIADFIAYLDHPALNAHQVRAELDQIELRAIRRNGYGTKSFTSNLVHCFEHLRGRPASDSERARVISFTDRIRNHPIRLLEGVAETLATLGSRIPLGLLSKGDGEEQLGKVQRSGLEHRFRRIWIVREKDADRYRDVVREINCLPSQVWMVGNSPKSDIHPALEAGLGAVLVPNACTWSLELGPLPEQGPRFRVVERFADLTELF